MLFRAKQIIVSKSVSFLLDCTEEDFIYEDPGEPIYGWYVTHACKGFDIL